MSAQDILEERGSLDRPRSILGIRVAENVVKTSAFAVSETMFLNSDGSQQVILFSTLCFSISVYSGCAAVLCHLESSLIEAVLAMQQAIHPPHGCLLSASMEPYPDHILPGMNPFMTQSHSVFGLRGQVTPVH